MGKADRQTEHSPLPLALTMGDPAGIGLDITLAAYQGRESNAAPPFYIHADPALLTRRAAQIGIELSLQIIDHSGRTANMFADQVTEAFTSAFPVVPLATHVKATAGKPDAASAAATLSSIERSVEDVHLGYASAVVTNPIAKDVLYAAGFSHPGHTEYLAALAHTYWGTACQSVMMLAAEEMRVVPATIHIPLKDVPAALTPAMLRTTLGIVLKSMKDDFGITRPRVVCAGLNPHAGENGAIGMEDREIIAPVIAELNAAGHDVSGPLPADTMFHADARAGVDCIVAMYHDQALIPIKTLAFDRGVNVTLGLPFVRTSPDHGTAFSIAGSGQANPRSLIEALKLAQTIARTRARTA